MPLTHPWAWNTPRLEAAVRQTAWKNRHDERRGDPFQLTCLELTNPREAGTIC